MKRLVKRIAGLGWRATRPIRRPIAERAASFLRRALADPEAQAEQARAAAELSVVLDHVARELIRLQDSVEALRDTVEEAREAGRAGPAGRLAG